MVNQPLLDYLRNAFQLEMDRYVAQEMLAEHQKVLSQEQEILRALQTHTEPIKEKTEKPKLSDFYAKMEANSKLNPPLKPVKGIKNFFESFSYALYEIFIEHPILSIIWAVFVLVNAVLGHDLALYFGEDGHLLIELSENNVYELAFNPCYLLTLIALGVMGIIIIVKTISWISFNIGNAKNYPQEFQAYQNKVAEQKRIAREEYTDALNEYQMMVQMENESIQEETNARRKEIEDHIARKKYEEKCILEYQKKIADISIVLSQVYDVGVIHSDYRSLVPVSMFVKYIEQERCYKLEGTNGAYNRYEDELRSNMIIGRLDHVLDSLDKIHASMGTLYRGMQTANRLLAELVDGMDDHYAMLEDSIHQQTVEQRWNAQLIADQTAALASIEEEKLYELRRLNGQY